MALGTSVLFHTLWSWEYLFGAWMFLYVPPHIVQSITYSRTFAAIVGRDFFRVFCYHMRELRNLKYGIP